MPQRVMEIFFLDTSFSPKFLAFLFQSSFFLEKNGN